MKAMSRGCANAENRPQPIMEEVMLLAVDSGIGLYVRNNYPREVNEFPAEKILLFVHGASYPTVLQSCDFFVAATYSLVRRKQWRAHQFLTRISREFQ